MRVALGRRAITDIGIAVKFYDRQGLGLGNKFEAAIFDDITSLASLHGFHPMRFGVHRLLATAFPFGIYYAATVDHIEVVAVLDLRADPARLARILQNRR